MFRNPCEELLTLLSSTPALAPEETETALKLLSELVANSQHLHPLMWQSIVKHPSAKTSPEIVKFLIEAEPDPLNKSLIILLCKPPADLVRTTLEQFLTEVQTAPEEDKSSYRAGILYLLDSDCTADVFDLLLDCARVVSETTVLIAAWGAYGKVSEEAHLAVTQELLTLRHNRTGHTLPPWSLPGVKKDKKPTPEYVQEILTYCYQLENATAREVLANPLASATGRHLLHSAADSITIKSLLDGIRKNRKTSSGVLIELTTNPNLPAILEDLLADPDNWVSPYLFNALGFTTMFEALADAGTAPEDIISHLRGTKRKSNWENKTTWDTVQITCQRKGLDALVGQLVTACPAEDLPKTMRTELTS